MKNDFATQTTYKRNKLKVAVTLFMFGLIIAAVFMMLYFYQQVRVIDNYLEADQDFKWHFAMISDAPRIGRWQEIFQGGAEQGRELDVYVENWGVHLQQDFPLDKHLEMAIAAQVDGIILASGAVDDNVFELTNRAVEAGIPVVTMITDLPGSQRNAFISLNDYAIGELFGQQLIEIVETRLQEGVWENLNVTVLIDNAQDVGVSSLIYRGIFEAIREYAHLMDISSLEVGGSGEFEAEERVRDLFLDAQRRPDVFITLNATNTMIARQSLVEYNLVGQVTLMGTSVNDIILEDISLGLIKSTVFIDERNMGAQAIELLNANVVTGYSSDYRIADVELITLENLMEFRSAWNNQEEAENE